MKLTKVEKGFSVALTIGVLIAILFFIYFLSGGGSYQLELNEDHFAVTNKYGDEWDYAEITSIELMDDLPEIKGRVFGETIRGKSLGNFTFQEEEPYEKGLLFVYRDNSPYIVIELSEHKPIFINAEDSNTTEEWFNRLSEKVNAS